MPLVCREHTLDATHWFQLHVILRIRVAFVYVTDARGSVFAYNFTFRAASVISALLVMLANFVRCNCITYEIIVSLVEFLTSLFDIHSVTVGSRCLYCCIISHEYVMLCDVIDLN